MSKDMKQRRFLSFHFLILKGRKEKGYDLYYIVEMVIVN